MTNWGWDLPPGVTNRMIEAAQGVERPDVCYVCESSDMGWDDSDDGDVWCNECENRWSWEDYEEQRQRNYNRFSYPEDVV